MIRKTKWLPTSLLVYKSIWLKLVFKLLIKVYNLYLKEFSNYEVYSVNGVNIKWDLWNEHFIEYYEHIIIYINNDKNESKKNI